MIPINRWARLLPVFLLLGTWSIAQEFRVRTDRERVDAIGETYYLPAGEKLAFRDHSDFKSKAAPKASDWLASHKESGQTFDQFLRGRRNLFHAPRNVLYILPVGEFAEKESEILKRVKTYAEIFFQAKVVIEKPLSEDKLSFTSRKNSYSGQLQYLSTDILKFLKTNLKRDAYARIAVTMTDLYPDESWNFVFGQASLIDRTGVYSFARYGEVGSDEFLRRCLRVFSHETGHMFAFRHCIHYQCLMNGVNNLTEGDQTPLHLCPICLRKLHAANRFEIEKRYEGLAKFYRGAKLEEEAAWAEDRVKQIKLK